MNGVSVPLLLLLARVGACRAFTGLGRSRYTQRLGSCRRDIHDVGRSPRQPWSMHHSERSDTRDPFQGVGEVFDSASAAAAASFVFAGATVLVHPLEASAYDMPAFSALQQREQVISSPRKSIENAFQGFVQRGTTPTIARTVRSMQLPTLLSFEQGSVINREKSIDVAATMGDVGKDEPKSIQQSPGASTEKAATLSQSQQPIKGELQASDVKKIVEENKIDVELVCKDDARPLDVPTPRAVVKVDRDTFQKVKIVQPPFLQYLPSSVQPLVSRQFQSLRVLKSIPNDQLFVASVVAGSFTEMIRTVVLYPLSTVKARVQARTARRTNRNRPLLRKLRVTWLSFLYETKRGDWYAGLVPTLLITAPASGVYSGAKEVSRRAFSVALQFELLQGMLPGDAAASSYYSALVVNLLAAFVADVASLAIRTPADVLALRLQVFGKDNVQSDFGNWAKDSVALLRPMLLTDTPFLLSRILLNAAITTSGENLGRYEFETIAIACLCAFLTTPFDVARTRILLPALPSEEESEESGAPRTKYRRLIASSKNRRQRREQLSVTMTMKRIASEGGGGGLQNLYAGWFERTAYLGLGRAWLDPLRVIGYLGIRDALLLKLFD